MNSIDKKMLIDIQKAVSRLVAKAGQLINNFTTNLAECWMHMRTKFDGGKVINRSQSGSFQHRCMGAGLRLNLGPAWGPNTWKATSGSDPNPIFLQTTTKYERQLQKDRKRKSTSQSKEYRRKNKYRKCNDNSLSARRAYSRHDDGIEPDEQMEDVPSDHLEEMKRNYYEAHVQVNESSANEIEQSTRQQGKGDWSTEQIWQCERHKRLTASQVGGIIKMRNTTKRANKVKQMLYSNFKGNKHTAYGLENEDSASQAYTTYMQQNRHSDLKTSPCGLVINCENPWLAATPDSRVYDPQSSQPHGLVEYKNPSTAQYMTIDEACTQIKGFCIKKQHTKIFLDTRHDYYHQIQCQLLCDKKEWCDFVVKTNQDLYIERVYQDKEWWVINKAKLKKFYFDSLLPELACPRHRTGGIREPANSKL